jgi:hypothetical protein
MNQPNDCPRFISEVAHERVVGELNRTIARLTEQVAALQASATVTTAAYEDWKKEAAVKLTAVAYQRDDYCEAAERATKQRDEFEKAWNRTCKEKRRLADLLGQVEALLRPGGAA